MSKPILYEFYNMSKAKLDSQLGNPMTGVSDYDPNYPTRLIPLSKMVDLLGVRLSDINNGTYRLNVKEFIEIIIAETWKRYQFDEPEQIPPFPANYLMDTEDRLMYYVGTGSDGVNPDKDELDSQPYDKFLDYLTTNSSLLLLSTSHELRALAGLYNYCLALDKKLENLKVTQEDMRETLFLMKFDDNLDNFLGTYAETVITKQDAIPIKMVWNKVVGLSLSTSDNLLLDNTGLFRVFYNLELENSQSDTPVIFRLGYINVRRGTPIVPPIEYTISARISDKEASKLQVSGIFELPFSGNNPLEAGFVIQSISPITLKSSSKIKISHHL